MRSALRDAMVYVLRRLLFAAIGGAAVLAFVAIAGATDAQPGDSVAIVPIELNPAVPSAALSPAATPTDLDLPAPARPAPAAPAPASVTVAKPRTTRVVTSPAAIAPAATGAVKGRYLTRPVTPSAIKPPTPDGGSVYHYVGERDVAQLINPSRVQLGWPPVSTVAGKNYATCLASQSCSGQVGVCGGPPSGIGNAATTVVYDGQYKDQYGNCREVIVS
jgi:hypothetical protein